MTVTKQILPAFVFFAAERSDFPPGKYAPPTPKMRTDFSPVRIFWTAPHKACVVLSYVKDYFESDGVWSGVFCAAVRAVLSRLFRRCAALSAGLSRRHSIGLTAVHAAGAAVCRHFRAAADRSALGIAVIASQQAITASPISAATVALLGLLAGFDITLFDILKITIPATIIGVLVGALFSMKVGKELVDDPEYQKRLAEGYFNSKKIEIKDVHNRRNAMISVLIFILATAFIVFFGSFDGMRPTFLIDGETVTLGMSAIIEIVMLSAAALILLITKTDGIKATQGSVFPAGMQAVIAIFGIAWMGDTFLQGNMGQLTESIEGLVRQMPWHCPVHNVHPALQPGCYGTCTDAVGYCSRHFTVYADRHVPGCKRIFLHSELSDSSGRHQFRPDRYNKNR